MLDQLKNLNIPSIDLDEAVALSAFGRMLKAEYETLGAETPEWLDNRLRELRREVKVRQQDSIEKRLREARARMETLKTPTERRDDLAKEIERLESLVKQ